jgi:Sortase domain
MTRRTAAAATVVAAAGLLVSVLTVLGWSRDQVAPVTTARSQVVDPPAPPDTAPDERETASDKRDASASDRSKRRIRTASATLPRRQAREAAPPVEVTIPSVGLRAPVRPVGVARDGQMQLPADPAVLGWYRFGPAPASPTGGSVVLAGHLDSNEFGLGPLVRLREVDLGSTITVATRGGEMLDYTVLRVQRFDRQRLPAELFGRTGRELLRLITCGGAYDPETGYEQNLVVTAAPVR